MSKARDLANAGTALASVTPTELAYLDGVTSAIQTQINNKDSLPSRSGNSGKYLTNNGTDASWGTVSQYSLPSQSGKAGKFLTTNGTTESWAAAAFATEIHNITTSREWLNTTFTDTGNYSVVLGAGTGKIFTYNSSNELLQQFAVSTTASIAVVTTAFSRMEAVASESTDLSITPVPAKITIPANASLAIDYITSSGTYGAGTGTSGYSYTAGQVAHVIVVGGGGGGGSCHPASPANAGGNGGGGGVSYTTSPITLTGTYTLSIGSGGNRGAGSNQSGGAGGSTTGFGFTSTGGAGGIYGTSAGQGANGASGSPSMPSSTNIFKPPAYSEWNGYGSGGVGVYSDYGTYGSGGVIIVLRWTPQ